MSDSHLLFIQLSIYPPLLFSPTPEIMDLKEETK